jgi:hypothetical protein
LILFELAPLVIAKLLSSSSLLPLPPERLSFKQLINSAMTADDKFKQNIKNSKTKFINRENRNEKVPSDIECKRSSMLSNRTMALLFAMLLVFITTTAIIDAK